MFQNIVVCNENTPMNVEDGAMTELVRTFKETNVPTVGDQGLRAGKKSGSDHSLVDMDHNYLLQVIVIPSASV